MEIRAELFERSAVAGAGGDRRRRFGQGHRALFQVSVSYIYKALARREATGETEARPQRNQQTLKLEDLHAAIAAEVAPRPDVDPGGAARLAAGEHQVAASLGLMHKTLARLGLTLKKSRGGQKSRTGPTSPSGAPTGAPSKVP